MSLRRFVVLAIVPLLTTSVLSPVAAQQSYVLGPDDVIEVSVFGSEDLSRVVAVRPDGMISLPLIGEVRAAGLTPQQLGEALTALYVHYVRNPQVVVIVREFRRVRVSVLGQVVRPGVYELRQGATMLDALAAAGGLTEAAGLGEVRLFRGQQPAEVIDLERLLLKGEITLNRQLEIGDTVLVPEDFTARVYVLGEVTRPGIFPLRGSMTVLQALSLAGGPGRRAILSRAYVIRRPPTPEQSAGTITLASITVTRQAGQSLRVIPIDLQKIIREGDVSRDILLQRGDILYVPENPLALETIVVVLGGLADLATILR